MIEEMKERFKLVISNRLTLVRRNERLTRMGLAHSVHESGHGAKAELVGCYQRCWQHPDGWSPSIPRKLARLSVAMLPNRTNLSLFPWKITRILESKIP